ncbi:hypothetical protein AA309_17795 [Microvirga vignae]|uniref:Uncharacterized protein n=1 Tax=Microvirga vignae TaxID=1225564 RepID=A0A0H1R9G6_9HYPH|nr:hypothetical protein [Microvirga vignae]KLK91845.1 hypothetical protein AA309_17795 [Microvirga vignae]
MDIEHEQDLAGEHKIEWDSPEDLTVFDESERTIAAEPFVAAANNISNHLIAEIERTQALGQVRKVGDGGCDDLFRGKSSYRYLAVALIV